MADAGKIAGTAYNLNLKALSTDAHTIANEATDGFFTSEVTFKENNQGRMGHGAAMNLKLIVNDYLSTEMTERAGDLNVYGSGMLPVSLNSNANVAEINYVKTGGFLPDRYGYLEDSGRFLMGYQYNSGILDKNALARTQIMDDLVSQPVKTDEISLSFKLNANTVATGWSGFLLREDNLAPGIISMRDANMILTTTSQSGGTNQGLLYNQQILTFGGFIESAALANGANPTNSLLLTDTAITINIVDKGGNALPPIQIKAAIAVANTNLQALEALRDAINNNHGSVLGAKILDDGTNASLMIFSKIPENTLQFVFTPELQNALGVTFIPNTHNSIMGINNQITNMRFSSFQQLNDYLKGLSIPAETLDAGKKIYIKSGKNEQISIRNQDNSRDITKLFSISQSVNGIAPIAYSALDATSNMAGGSVRPDFQEHFDLIDSKGGSRLITVGFKKISPREYVIEAFTQSNQLDTSWDKYRTDGLLQVCKITFDDQGNFTMMDAITPTVVSTNSVRNFVSLIPGAADGDTIIIGGTTYTYKQVPTVPATLADFNSLLGLVDAINVDSATTKYVASLVPSNSGYKVLITSGGGNITVDGTGNAMSILGFNKNDGTSDVSIFGQDALDVVWAVDSTGVEQSNITLNINSQHVKELRGQSGMMSHTKNGSLLGVYNGWYIDKNGDVITKFTNSAPELKLYNIPIAVFAAPQFFGQQDGVYKANDETGPAIMRKSGEFAGILESGMKGKSDANSTIAMINTIDHQQSAAMNTHVLSKKNDAISNFLQKI